MDRMSRFDEMAPIALEGAITEISWNSNGLMALPAGRS
jgi:hypothetical protein